MNKALSNTCTIFRRELKSYFESPVAYVFMIVFLLLTGFLTFSVNGFYERRIADLDPFFFWHPWVYLLLVPAATMGLWAEERRTGTIELLLTMPLTMTQAIVGKFLAAWLFIAMCVLLTAIPMVGTVIHLGSPDTGAVVCGYLGSVLLAGAYVAVGMLASSLTRNQVISFVLALTACFVLLLAGWEPVTGFFSRWAPAWVVNGVAALSFMPHYDAIKRGVVDLADVAYYASVIAFMLTAAHITLGERKNMAGISRGTVALLALFVILAATNVIARNLRLRGDFTGEKLYSLSDGSRNLLAGLEEPVTLKLFFTSSNPRVPSGLRNYARQVEDLLTEYRLAGKGNIIVQKLDPKPDSDEEEWARKYGISGQSIEMFGPPLYFGLVASAGSTEAVLPGLDPRMQETLEFNISRMIHQVTHPEKKGVGVISSLPVLGGSPPMMPGMPPMQPPQPAWIAFQELRKDYDVQMIDNPEAGIPQTVDVLVVAHPKTLSPRARFAIDQHVLRGGRAVILVDPLSVADQESGAPANPYGMPQLESDLPDLLKAWGIGYTPSGILADFNATTPMRTPEGGIEQNPVVVSYTRAAFDEKNVMTAGLQTIRAAFAGTLQDQTGDKLTVTPLITASTQSGTVPAMAARRGGRGIRESFTAAPEPRHLALQLSGTFQTAFPEGRPAAEGEEDEDEPMPAAEPLTSGDSTVIVVADVDMLFDPICVEAVNFFGQTVHRPLNDNLTFFANVIDGLAGGSDLISIRSRQGFNRPFTHVDEIEANAVSRWREQEAQLEASLREAQQQINQLQAGKTEDQQFILSDSQRAAIERFKQQEFEIKQELKQVRKNLRSDIERLGIKVKAINIALMPLLVGIGGIVYGLRRKHS